ncbi:MAG: hypothetical protein VXZ27_03005 [SAR324 cluster bacterium]|nr:hypothetical protein [SAR324 cluster bacterium]MEC8434784.1 hypothetical protein [SAR324 cluster bacterium]
MAKQPNENKDTPNVNLLKIQQELEELAKEVLAMEGKGFFAKLGLGKKTKEVTPATGTDILEIAFLRGDKEINKLVSQLSGDPQNQAIRMQMVGRALQMEGRPQLEVARALLIHSCLPFYWGEVTGPAVQMLLRTFKLYLERILQIHKEKMMAIQSNVLKGVNLSGIEVNEDDMEDSGVGNRAGMMMEIKICEGLLEKINEASTTLQNKMGVSLSKYELDLALGKGGGGGMFGSEGSDINVEQVQGIVTTKIMHSIDMIKLIPMMNSAGLSLAGKMKEIEDKIPYPWVMIGRLNQQMVRYHIMRMEAGDDQARPFVAPAFNAAVVAYRRSMKTVSQSMPKKQDLPALAEFANLTYYGYINRQIMRLDKEGLKKLLQAGKDAADAAMTVDESYAPMQARLLRACNSMGMGLSEGETQE